MKQIPLDHCYQILDIAPGACIEAVEAAYARKAMAILWQGERGDREQLKIAYHQVKEDVLGQAATIADAQTAAHTPAAQILQHLYPPLDTQGIHPHVSVKEQTVLVQLQADRVPSKQLAIWVYNRVRQLDLPKIQALRVYGLQSNRTIAWKRTFSITTTQLTRDDLDPFSFNNRLITAGTFPAAMLIAMVINSISIFKFYVTPFRIWIHELGHATVAWLTGRRATPLPFGWTNIGEERSIMVYACFLALLGLLFWSGWREQKRWPMFLAGILAVIQFYMTWIMPNAACEMWISFGGAGGELYLSTFLIVCFYLPLPDRWRWDFWRYPVIVTASSTFVDSFWQWHQIERGTASIPWGTLFGGESDAGGDMNRLSLDYGWSDGAIIQIYSQLGNLCLLILLGVYVFFVLKQNWAWVVKPGIN